MTSSSLRHVTVSIRIHDLSFLEMFQVLSQTVVPWLCVQSGVMEYCGEYDVRRWRKTRKFVTLLVLIPAVDSDFHYTELRQILGYRCTFDTSMTSSTGASSARLLMKLCLLTRFIGLSYSFISPSLSYHKYPLGIPNSKFASFETRYGHIKHWNHLALCMPFSHLLTHLATPSLLHFYVIDE